MKRAKQIFKNKIILKSQSVSREDFGVVIFAFLGFLFVVFAYVFLISAGTWNNWFTTTTHYDQLAESFRTGNLWIKEEPDPALLALPNPYDPAARAGIPYPQDVSLYKEKFYLYFGPVPAMILTFIKPLVRGGIGDQYLVFSFMFGILFIQTILVAKIVMRFYTNAPSWLILPIILFMGLMSPYGWMMSLASVYNAAILSGQFFFLAGLFSAFYALDQSSVSKSKLALTGFFWVCAIGSRMTQIIPVGFMVIMVLGWLLIKHREHIVHSNLFREIFALGIPMLIGAVGLGWYNWARFDSVLESGITYQLAGVNLQKYENVLFSYRYIANNIYNYFLIKPGITDKFPFLGPVQGYNEPIIKAFDLPKIYFSQETAGLLYVAPFILFSIVSAITILKSFRKDSALRNQEALPFAWILISLAGSFFASMMFFLFFFWAGVRYLADFMPALAMLSVFGFLKAHQLTSKNRFARFLLTMLGLVLIVVTIVNSNLVALSISSGRYKEFNPQLWNQVIKLLNKLFFQ